MTVDPTNAGAAGLIERAKNIIITPQAEWERIKAEPADVQKIYTMYVLPLAALAALCGFVGMSVFGVSAFGVSYKVPLVAGLVGAVVQVGAAMLGIFVLAMIINALAPNFGSTPDQGKAHQLAAYSWTAAFLAGCFAIIPALSMLSILGLYSLVLLFIGLPRLMNTPEDKRIVYLLVIIVVAIVVWIVIGVVVNAVLGAMGGLPTAPRFNY